MGNFDIFYNAADRTSFSHTRTAGFTSGATELLPEGSAFTLSPAPTVPFAVGQRCNITDGVATTYCVVRKVTSSTNITLLPLNSMSDLGALPYTYPNASVIAVVDEVAASCVIELSEAPEDAYDFLLVACGSLTTTGTPGNVSASLRINALQDDPYSGTTGHGACLVTLGSASFIERVNFVAATKLELSGGQRYEHALNFNSSTATITTINNPRLLALRYLAGFFAGDGKTAQQLTTDATNFSDHLDLGANIPAGDYLVACTWVLGSASGVGAECRLEADGSTILANQISIPKGSSNFIPGGFFGVVTLGATNRLRLRYRSVGGAQCAIKNAFLAAIPVASIPALAATHKSQDLTTDASQVVTNNDFVAMKTSDSVNLESGRHIEIVSASVGASQAFRSRPSFGAAGTGLGNHNIELGTGSTNYVPTFWFIRNERTAGATTNALEMRRSTTDSTTLRARDFSFSWLRELADFRAQPDEPIAVVADIEMGGRVYKHWNSTTTTRRYVHRISDYDMQSRVRVNPPAGSPLLTEYVRVYSLADLSDGEWFWDALAHDLYIQLTTDHAAIGEPSSDALHVVVVPLLLAGLGDKYNLVDAFGITWPYRPLLESMPTKTQSLHSAGARFSTASTLGQLKLAMAHGEFDDRLFRSNFESYRARVRRGFPRKSMRLEDFEVIADATIRRPQSDIKTVTLRLLDRRRLLQTPIANTRITVRQGYGSDARERENQELPVVWGETLGLVAYRITANEGGTDDNEYRFCDHAVPSVTNVWIDGERRNAVGSGDKDVTATYIATGKVLVNNAAFDEPTQPPDVVYVDLSAGRTSDGTVSGRPLHYYGEQARDLIFGVGGTPALRILERTIRMVDRRWRWQQKVAGGGRRPVPPRLSLVVSGKTSVEQALTQLSGDVHAYWIVNHQDRVGVDVPDFDRGLMTRNHGFEEDSLYPWSTLNNATLAITTARKYEGAQSAEITNGSPANAEACARQSVLLAADNMHAVTLVASLLEGTPDAFRIGVVGPSGVETLSDPATLGTGVWTRVSVVYESVRGDTGFTELRLYPAYGSTVPTHVAVDNVEMYRVACVTDRVKSIPQGIEWEDEGYYECAVPFAVNRQNTTQISKRVVGESEARGLSSAIEPEGKYAIQSATRAELDDTRAADGDSAGGIAAAVALQYSRQRPVLSIDVYGLERLPLVGDYVMHLLNPRIPESADEYPIWRIAEVGYGRKGPTCIELKLRRQLDPIIDRVNISPDNIPMGAGAFTLASGPIADYDDIATLAGQFIACADTPDLTIQRGYFYHRHPLSHFHNVPNHDHLATLVSHGLDAEGDLDIGYWPVEHIGDFQYPGPVGPQTPIAVSRGATDGGHTHSLSGSGDIVAASGQSSAPNTALETLLGPIEPTFRRVRILQRIGDTELTISEDLVIGYPSTSIPAGWERVTELDGYVLRVATSNGAVSTRVTTAAFTTSEAGSTLNVLSATGITVGKRLEVKNTADSNKVVHVVVTALAGTVLTVFPLHETGDQANGYSFPNAAASTVTGDTEVVGTTFAGATHSHGGTIGSHVHAGGGHSHAAVEFDTGPADSSVQAQLFLTGSSTKQAAAPDWHGHHIEISAPPDNTNSGSGGGSITGDVALIFGYYELVFIRPSDPNQKTIPAGAVLPWTQSDIAPGGWEKIESITDLLLKGAETGQNPVSSVAVHTHTAQFDAHSYDHAHGGTVIQPSEGPGVHEFVGEKAGSSEISVAGGEESGEKGHAHPITASLASGLLFPSNGAVTLLAKSQTTGVPAETLPLHKRIVLIRKL